MQTHSVAGDGDLVLESGAGKLAGDVILKSGGVERGRINYDGTGSGLIGTTPSPVDSMITTDGTTTFRRDGRGVIVSSNTDAAVVIQAALTAGGHIAVQDATYTIGTTLTAAVSGTRLDLGRATLKKAASMSTRLFNVTTDDVTVVGGTFDGNKAGGATSYVFVVDGTGGSALRCRAYGTRSVNGKGAGAAGFFVFGASGQLGELYCHGTYVADHDVSAGSGGFGYYAGIFGRLHMDSGCVAEYCQINGVLLDPSSSAGSVIKGRMYRIGTAGSTTACGVRAKTSKGTLDVTVEECANFGVFIDGVDKWHGTVEAINTGTAFNAHGNNFAGDNAGTSCRILTGTRNKLRVISKGPRGYGLSLVTTSTRNDIWLDTDQTDAGDGDPGLTIQGGSSYNRVWGSIRGHTAGVTMGEGNVTPNDHNDLRLSIEGCTSLALQIDAGRDNTIEITRSRDNVSGTSPNNALVSLTTANTIGNEITILDHKETSGGAATTCPLIGVHCDANATDNRVTFLKARDIRILAWDENGNNVIKAEKALKVTQLATFDSSETGWDTPSGSGTVSNNTTAGQYVEGNGGKRFLSVASGAYTTYAQTLVGGPFDLSAMGADEWFRMFINVEAFGDAYAGGPIILRLRTDATNYYSFTLTTFYTPGNGGFWVYMRKGDGAATLSPNWNSIASVAVLIRSNAAGTFAVTCDDLARVSPRRFETVQNIARPVSSAITVGTSPFVYTVPHTLGFDQAHVQVTGGTVSAIAQTSDGTFYDTGVTAGILAVRPGDLVKVTYSVTPTMKLIPSR